MTPVRIDADDSVLEARQLNEASALSCSLLRHCILKVGRHDVSHMMT